MTSSQAEADKAKATPIELKVSQPRSGCITAVKGSGFFCDYVRKVFLTDPAFGKTKTERQKLWDERRPDHQDDSRPQVAGCVRPGRRSKQSTRTTRSRTRWSRFEPGTGKIRAMAPVPAVRPGRARTRQRSTSRSTSQMGGSYAGFQVGLHLQAHHRGGRAGEGHRARRRRSPRRRTDASYPADGFSTCSGRVTDGKRAGPSRTRLPSEKGTVRA